MSFKELVIFFLIWPSLYRDHLLEIGVSVILGPTLHSYLLLSPDLVVGLEEWCLVTDLESIIASTKRTKFY